MMTVFLVRAVRFIRMRKQIQGRKTAVNGRVISDIRSDLSDQETEGCYAMPYKIYGVHTITSLLITLHMSHSVFDKSKMFGYKHIHSTHYRRNPMY
jgi:hypothetical protein